MKYLLLFFICFLIVACTIKQDNPPVFWDNTPTQALLAAQAHAQNIDGRAFYVMPTGSMEPFLTGGDYIVVDTKFEYSRLGVGQVITYIADWAPSISPPATHRLAERDAHGWILEGDANQHYESHWRVTERNYVGKVVAVYTTRHQK